MAQTSISCAVSVPRRTLFGSTIRSSPIGAPRFELDQPLHIPLRQASTGVDRLALFAGESCVGSDRNRMVAVGSLVPEPRHGMAA